MVITILIFIIILGLLVFVHEFGHFIVAKKSGMKVEEFGFGFPPRLAGIQKINGKFNFVWGHRPPKNPDQTVYSVNWIPLGGFVKILGEDNAGQDDPRSFINKGFWPRVAVLVAGVTMNVLLAWVLISAGYIHGLPVAVNSLNDVPAHAIFANPKITIIDVEAGKPAEQAGLKSTDVVVSVDEQHFGASADLQKYILAHQGNTFHFVVERNNQQKFFDVKSLANPPAGEGPTGIILGTVGLLKYGFFNSFWQGVQTIGSEIRGIYGGLYQLLTGKVAFTSLGGPVKIAQLTGQVAGLGFIYLVQFTAFLSLNLAVLNILPFPALDGGRVLFLIIEKIRGKRNNQTVEQWANTAGFVLLLLLMLAVTVKDVIMK